MNYDLVNSLKWWSQNRIFHHHHPGWGKGRENNNVEVSSVALLIVSQSASQSVSQLVRVQLYLASPSLFIKSFRPMIAWLVATAAPRYRPLTQTTSLVSHRLWSSLLSLLSIDIFINQENKVNESERWHFWKYYNGESHVPELYKL